MRTLFTYYTDTVLRYHRRWTLLHYFTWFLLLLRNNISLSGALRTSCKFVKIRSPFRRAVAWRTQLIRIYKYTWTCTRDTCTRVLSRIHRKYSFVRRLVRASCSRINTFLGTGHIARFIAHFVLSHPSSSTDLFFSLCASIRSSCTLYNVDANKFMR